MRKAMNTVDLFCGAGGASTGMCDAFDEAGINHRGLCINHWSVAVDTMKLNHPDLETKRMSIEEAVPADLVRSGVVDLLWASPSCTHHSRAKGGRPRSNQLRSQPELVLTWLDQLYVRRMIIENVPEFVEWGPLNKDGQPIKSKRGACFKAWVAALEARNYIVDWRIVNCADFGDATTRRRFFLKAVRRGCGRIAWPEPTFAEHPSNGQSKWRGVSECIDFSDVGTSIFNRRKPLAKNTMRRIAAGLRKYCGLDFQMDMLGSNGPDDRRLRSLSEPIRTQHTCNRTAIVRPFVVRMRNSETAQSVDDPINTISAGGQHHMLCQPFIVNNFEHGAPRSVNSPVHALTTGNHIMLCNPMILDHTRNGKVAPVSSPIGAQTTHDRYSVITPMVLGQNGGSKCQPVDRPCPTIATKGAVRVVTPLVLGRDACARCRPASKPMPTLTCGGAMRGIFPILEDGRVLDVRIRMLKPSELAAAHSFPADYVLTGTRCDQVKQIGNSVPVRTAKAMCLCDIRELVK